MGRLTAREVESLAKTRGRYGDGDGLYLKVLDPGRRIYWVYRFSIGGKEREASVGPYPEFSLAEARIKHAALRKTVVVDKIDPLAQKRAAKAAMATPSVKPTFGECADRHVASHEASWRSPKSAEAWRMTLMKYCAPIRETPVDQVDTEAVLACLKPLWSRTPETASRLRGRIEAVLASAQVDGHIHQDRTNPARWRGWLDRKLPNPKKIGERGHYAALAYSELPDFMRRLSETPGVPAKALAFIVLTAARSGEALGATWDEVDLDAKTWTVPKERMKKGERPHDVPLSDQALAILRGQYETRGKNPHVFPSHLPRQALSIASLAAVMERLGAKATRHGMRASFRMWAADQGVAFEVAEACLAHTVGSAVVQAYQRSSMLERRKPVMDAWCAYVMPTAKATKIVPLRGRQRG